MADQFRNNLDDIAPLCVNGGYDVTAFHGIVERGLFDRCNNVCGDAGLEIIPM